MPNKTIYVSDDDLGLYQRAQELAGGNLSAAIAKALRRYVELEEGRQAGFDEITVRVGIGSRRKQRFSGILLGEWVRSSDNRYDLYRVYRTRKGKFALYVDRSPDWTWTPEFDAEGWRGVMRKHLGLGDQSWGFRQGEATLEVFDSLDAMRDKIPPELYDMVASLATEPAVQDLDI